MILAMLHVLQDLAVRGVYGWGDRSTPATDGSRASSSDLALKGVEC
jgi:hypothetical protein